MITKEQLAAKLNNCEYQEETTPAIEEEAKENNLVIVFGYSDDLVEFRGAIDDEYGCGGNLRFGQFVRIPLTFRGVLEDCPCSCVHWEKAKTESTLLYVYKEYGFWSYNIDIPYATFDVQENGEKYCRGLVFSLDDLP